MGHRIEGDPKTRAPKHPQEYYVEPGICSEDVMREGQLQTYTLFQLVSA